MRRGVQLLGRFIIGASLLGLLPAARLPINRPLKASAGSQQVFAFHPSTSGVTVDTILEKLLEHDRLREAHMRQYSFSVPRTYRVRNDKGKVRAEAQVRLSYRAPGTKEFEIVSQTGVGLIHGRVFKPLMESEVAAGRNRHSSAISPANYTFNLLGEEDVGGHHCFVVQATPKRADNYLFKGTVWIHAVEFAVVKIAGQPSQNPSFWTKRVDFVRHYQKVGEFWLPLKDESVTQVKVVGKYTLTIDHHRYEFTQVAGVGKE